MRRWIRAVLVQPALDLHLAARGHVGPPTAQYPPINATLHLDRVGLDVGGGYDVAHDLTLRLKQPLVKRLFELVKLAPVLPCIA